MDEAELVDGLDGHDNLCHIKSSNVFREDFILDQHGHQVTTGKKLHQHVQERVILERGVKLDDPWTVRLC